MNTFDLTCLLFKVMLGVCVWVHMCFCVCLHARVRNEVYIVTFSITWPCLLDTLPCCVVVPLTVDSYHYPYPVAFNKRVSLLYIAFLGCVFSQMLRSLVKYVLNHVISSSIILLTYSLILPSSLIVAVHQICLLTITAPAVYHITFPPYPWLLILLTVANTCCDISLVLLLLVLVTLTVCCPLLFAFISFSCS